MINSYCGTIDVLKQFDWYPQFKVNFKKSNKFLSLKRVIELLIKEKRLGDLINRAFNWDDTPEGFDFWEEADTAFTNRIIKHAIDKSHV